MRTRITKREVDAAKPGERDAFVWDRDVKGFGLKVTPAGRKVYVLQYRIGGGSTKRYTIGRHGAPWTPDAARAKALALLGDVARGVDPSDVRRQEKTAITVAELCDLYLAEGTRTKKLSTVAMDRSRIERHVKPLLGRKRLESLARQDVERFVADIAAGKTARDERTGARGRSIVRGGEIAANRTLATLAPILQFAVERGLRPDNPARGVRKYKERRHSRFLSNDEVVRLGDALRTAEAEGVNPSAIAAIRLLLLTGCRRNEILSLRWDEVDFACGYLRFGDSKTGSKDVHLAAPAKELIAGLPREAGNRYVIRGDRPGTHLVGLQKVWNRVRAAAGLPDVRLHDLRHSYASVGARGGESLLVLGKVLGHATTAATSRYAHLSDDPVRLANERISQEIAANLNGAAGEVVELKHG